jgi:hypothetical protein
MAVAPGRRPKNPDTRVRRNRATTADQLPAAPAVAKPSLPDPPAGSSAWHPIAAEWWTDLWESPQASRYTAMHKHRAYLALHTLHLFYSNPTERLGQRVEVALEGLGFSENDLRRLQWNVPVAPPAAATASKEPAKRAPRRVRDPRSVLRSIAGGRAAS